MKTFDRVCVEDYIVTDREGTSFTVTRGHEYTTSPEKDGEVIVFSRYWVKVPRRIFAGSVPGPGDPHDSESRETLSVMRSVHRPEPADPIDVNPTAERWGWTRWNFPPDTA